MLARRGTDDLADSSPVRTHAQSLAETEPPSRAVLAYGGKRICCCDMGGLRCATVETDAFLGRLRLTTPHGPASRAKQASREYLLYELAPPRPPVRNTSTTATNTHIFPTTTSPFYLNRHSGLPTIPYASTIPIEGVNR